MPIDDRWIRGLCGRGLRVGPVGRASPARKASRTYQHSETTRCVMFTKVIWATDGSEHADRAMPLAVQVAKTDGAELHVVHVVEKLIGVRVGGRLVHLRRCQQGDDGKAEHGQYPVDA